MNNKRQKDVANPRPCGDDSTSEKYVCPELIQIIHRTRLMSVDKVIRRSELKSKCGRARSTSYLDVAAGVFPPPFLIGEVAKGFSANELDAWIAACAFLSSKRTSAEMKAFVSLLVQSRI